MRTPIAHALAYPDRIVSGVPPLDLAAVATLQFEKPDNVRFPCLGLAFAALRQGGTASAALNAANEVAVDAFLTRRVRFSSIAGIVEDVLAAMTHGTAHSLEDVLAADEEARRIAAQQLARHVLDR
jgi:1-deoxy-D-xylulose-5-phosphate reductoisomerase